MHKEIKAYLSELHIPCRLVPSHTYTPWINHNLLLTVPFLIGRVRAVFHV